MQVSISSFAVAGPLLVVTGPPAASIATFGNTPSEQAAQAIQWSQFNSWNNVHIDVLLAAIGFSGTAYVTNQVGPSATAANILASTNFTTAAGANGSFTTVDLFDGLTLGAGTYYLVIGGGTTQSGWGLANVPNQTAGSGVNFTGRLFWDVSAGPGVNFPTSPVTGPFAFANESPIVNITGDATPEPATVSLALGGLCILWAGSRARRSGRN